MKRNEIVVGGFYVQKKSADNVRYVWLIDEFENAHWLGFDAKTGDYYGAHYACDVGTLARLSERPLTDDEAKMMKLEAGIKAFKDSRSDIVNRALTNTMRHFGLIDESS